MFVAPRLTPHFHTVWGVRRKDESVRLGRHARAILKVLRREWEMGTADLRAESGVTDRVAFTRGIDELQAAMLVVPSEVLYSPRFTYLWTLAVGRFPDALTKRMRREIFVREIARAFLTGAGMTVPGELARVTGLSRPEAGFGRPRARRGKLARLRRPRAFIACRQARARRTSPEMSKRVEPEPDIADSWRWEIRA